MKLQPFSFNGAEVRTVTENDQPWFVAADVCRVLDISNITEAMRGLDDDEFSTTEVVDGAGKRQSMRTVSESGLYSLVLRSRKPEAKAFKRWITHEVLPAIRKTGSYAVATTPALPANYLDALKALVVAEEGKAQLQIENESMLPKVAYFNTVAASGDSHLVREAAKLLKNGWGEKKLFAWLRDHSYLMKNNEPYQEHVNRGYFTFTQSTHTSPRSGKVYLRVTPRITGKGMVHIHSVLSK